MKMVGVNEVRRLKQLEIGNTRLKEIVAERDLEIEVMKEIAAKHWHLTRAHLLAGDLDRSTCKGAEEDGSLLQLRRHKNECSV